MLIHVDCFNSDRAEGGGDYIGMRKSIVVEALQSISLQMQFLLHIGFGHTWWWLDTNICELLLDQMLGFSLHIVFFLIYQMHFTTHGLQSSACWIVSHWMKQMKFICLLFEKSTLNRIKFPILDPILEKKEGRRRVVNQRRQHRAWSVQSKKKGAEIK